MNLTDVEWDLLIFMVEDSIADAIKTWQAGDDCSDLGLTNDETIDALRDLLVKVVAGKAAAALAAGDME